MVMEKKLKIHVVIFVQLQVLLQHEMVVKWLRISFMATEVKVQISLLTSYDCKKN
jgi:uncharacterized protein YqfA (UPF0365 family)